MKLSENRYQVSGDLDPEDFFDEIDYDYPEQDFEELNSFAGWALETLERIPEPGASFTYRDMEILVKEVTDQRIVTLEVIFHPKEEITEKISEK